MSSAIENLEWLSIFKSLEILLNGLRGSVSNLNSSSNLAFNPLRFAYPPEINSLLKFEFPLLDFIL